VKDITTGITAAVGHAGDAAENPCAADADTALPDRAHCAKLDGTRNNRNAGVRGPT
jgi:hypothetical protein